MKIARYRPDNWVKDHPTGAIAFQHLLRGDPGSPDNFMLILGRQDGDFHMPRHRHNFDQIRLPIVGPMDHGDFVLGEGEVGYFVEGLAYGPQDDPLGRYAPGERLVALDAVQSEPGERLTLASASGAELFLIGLPPVHSAAAAGATLLEAPIGEGAL